MSEEKESEVRKFLLSLRKRLDEGESEDMLAQEFEQWFKKYDDT